MNIETKYRHFKRETGFGVGGGVCAGAGAGTGAGDGAGTDTCKYTVLTHCCAPGKCTYRNQKVSVKLFIQYLGPAVVWVLVSEPVRVAVLEPVSVQVPVPIKIKIKIKYFTTIANFAVVPMRALVAVPEPALAQATVSLIIKHFTATSE